jgi:hypothetical protein
MKRTVLLVIASVAAVAAIVVLTTGAIAGTAGKADQPDDGFSTFISCLAFHGVQVPSNDPVAVKRWLADRYESDSAVKAAVEACAPKADKKKEERTKSGPTAASLVACLERHQVDVPSDAEETPVALKRWLGEAMEQPSVRAALDACVGGPASTGTKQ